MAAASPTRAPRSSEANAHSILDAMEEEHVKSSEQGYIGHSFAGLKVLVFVANTPVCKATLALTKGVLGKHGACNELILAHCAPNPYGYEGMLGVLDQMAEPLAGFPVRTELWQKPDDMSLIESLQEYTQKTNPDLVIIGSKSLAGTEAKQTALRNVALPAIPAKSPIVSQSFAYKLAQALRKYPLLIYKSNTKGSFLSYVDQASAPVKYMIDLQPTSRFMLGWLLNVMDLDKDHLFMSVGKAFEPNGVTKQVAMRMVTMFTVQASAGNKIRMKPAARLLKHESERDLPAQVVADDIDILLIQAPRCRDLSPYVQEVLSSTPAAILIYPPDANDTSLGSSTRMERTSSGAPTASGDMDSPRERQRYSYTSGGPPVVDSAAQAALDAMAKRQAARRQATDDQAKAHSTSQRLKY
uniref:UspA domain-containing protein n=1 Tax=Chlamydomonas euryale TaxID=1486919 RepID=A0A7R9VIZ2_9CHLO